MSHFLQDFLFPRSLRAIYSQHQAVPHQLPPVDTDRPFFPPVKHLSFQSPVTTCPDSHLKAMDAGKPVRMPSVNPSILPSAGGVQKLQLTQPAADLKLVYDLRNPSRYQLISLIIAQINESRFGPNSVFALKWNITGRLSCSLQNTGVNMLLLVFKH